MGVYGVVVIWLCWCIYTYADIVGCDCHRIVGVAVAECVVAVGIWGVTFCCIVGGGDYDVGCVVTACTVGVVVDVADNVDVICVDVVDVVGVVGMHGYVV